jgi:hypothetical protein
MQFPADLRGLNDTQIHAEHFCEDQRLPRAIWWCLLICVNAREIILRLNRPYLYI